MYLSLNVCIGIANSPSSLCFKLLINRLFGKAQSILVIKVTAM